MGVCVQVLHEACAKKIQEVAEVIEGEMKEAVSKGAGKAQGRYATGAAVGAVHIENTGEFSRFVGGTGGAGTLHMYFLNEGNGGGRIYPKHSPALHLQSPGLNAWAKSVSSYSGTHYVEAIAERHGG